MLTREPHAAASAADEPPEDTTAGTTPAGRKAKKRAKRPTFQLSDAQAETYEDELRGRIGLLPRGATLPRTIRIQGWIVTLVAALVALGTRLWNLTHPRAIIFDETYYVKGAFSLLRMGYEGNWDGDNANDLFLEGDYSALQTEADRVVHPPFGKWVMAIGQWLFGTDNGVGWRFSTAALGVLSVILIVRIAMRLFRSPWLAGFAGLAMALDGMGIVLSRTGILDNVLAFFVLLGFYFVLLDRERHGGRLAHRVAHGLFRDTPEARAAVAAGDLHGSQLLTADPWAARSFARPWLVAAGISLGLACGVKWSGIYAVAAFGLLVLVFGVAARRSMGAPLYFGGAAFRDGVPAFLALVPTALVTYIAQWYPWFRNPNSLDRNWAAEAAARGESMPISWAPDVVNSFVHYHQDMWSFHHNLSSEHTYQSQAWEWLVQGRPVSFYWKDEGLSCGSSKCVEAITSVGNVAVWWLGLVGLLAVIFGALARSDWRAWAILAGYAGLWAPWLLYTNRTIFQFYAVVLLPFVVLALTYAVGMAARLLGPSRSGATFARRRGLFAGRRAAGAAASPVPYEERESTTAAGDRWREYAPPAAYGRWREYAPPTYQEYTPAVHGQRPEAAVPGQSPQAAALAPSPDLPDGVGAPYDSGAPYAGTTEPVVRAPDDFAHVIDGEPDRQWWLPRRARISSYVLVCTVGVVILAAAVFWFPIWTGMTVPRSFWQMHMWFNSWI
ncbi:MAG: phospholipid carrier-dependent glycosyltransferase [Actinomycetaceae bacterium]|nr:phospholipid carrier-dependent glycosyltransferase [Actinomycetaceae bacterium]